MKFSKLVNGLIALLLFVAACSKKSSDTPDPTPPPVPVVVGENDPIYTGNPTNAQPSSAYPENYLKDNSYYRIGYSSSRGIPTWVAWHLQSEDIGSTPRQDDFRADSGLPSGWFRAEDAHYSGSGFDRGHNCPSGDRTTTVAANSSTFLMTNMIPQAPTLNQGPWEGLEEYVRTTLVGGNNEAYIVTGSYGRGGYNANGLLNTIASGYITVPAKVWKVVLVIPKGNGDLARINRNSTVLAVTMPNDNRLYTTSNKTAWRDYLTSITNVEIEANASGVPLNLLQAVPDSVRPLLKAKIYQ